MCRTNQMGQTGGIGVAATARYGGPRARTFVRQIGEIPSTVRRRVYSRARNGAWRLRRRDCRADHDQATFRDKLDRLQSHDTRQSVSSPAPADIDAVSKTAGSLSLHLCNIPSLLSRVFFFLDGNIL